MDTIDKTYGVLITTDESPFKGADVDWGITIEGKIHELTHKELLDCVKKAIAIKETTPEEED